ncbi:hypothetical protein GOODEAATRI_022572 [Goodea atripinnis]|uniref:Uncharacterized protein n=1 Tax=Goodea atripinnis TaxID=208336 RepID=A0ABV0N3U9_9TELE
MMLVSWEPGESEGAGAFLQCDTVILVTHSAHSCVDGSVGSDMDLSSIWTSSSGFDSKTTSYLPTNTPFPLPRFGPLLLYLVRFASVSITVISVPLLTFFGPCS